MQQPEMNNGQQLQVGVPGLAATVMLMNVGADGQADWQSEPVMQATDDGQLGSCSSTR